MLRYADVPKERVLEELNTSFQGLTEEQAGDNLKKYGANQLKEKKKRSVIALFFSQLGDVMTALLIAAACISGVIAYLSSEASDLADTAIIISIILLNAVVGTVQQYRADKAIESLKKLTSATARVRRGGIVREIDVASLTVGDIVLLEEGDVVPADMRLLSSSRLVCDESALTGEAQGAQKYEGIITGRAINYSNASNLLFSSAFVLGGKGEGVVTAVGKDTEIGKIAEMLNEVKKDASPLERSLNILGKVISVFVIAVAAVIFAVGYFAQGTGLIKNFMTAVAIAVAAVPEGLPAVVSVIMAMGVQRMSKQNVVIRKMKCVETLGGCSCICTDKTGTLTQNKMKVVKVIRSENADNMLLACMAICTGVKGVRGSYLGDPTEIAVKNYAVNGGFDKEYKVLGEIPFSSERKLMSVGAELEGGQYVFVKGAPEEVIKRCVNVDGGEVLKQCEEMSSQALRTLAFAYRRGGELKEEGLTYLGALGMIDGLKEGVAEAVAACKNAGVNTVMITGDSASTAFAVAKMAGICTDRTEVYTGEQLDNMSKPQLNAAIKKGRVFARVSPRHKNIIVQVKKAQGEVVAMTGDGVNDAPSIKCADIGIVMGKSGTEVTKSVADMVIADDNFTTIVAAVREGRRISSNVKKTIQFFLSTNLAEVLAIVLVTFIFFGKNFLPSTQLLWINLITDSFPVLALGVERGGADDMKHPPIRAERALFSPSSLAFTLASSLYITGVTVGAYAFTLINYGNGAATTVAFLILSFSELMHAFNVRSGNGSAFKGMFSNRVLIATVLLGVGVNVALCLSPLAAAFSLSPLPISLWLLVFGIALSVILFGELYKLVAYIFKGLKSK